MQVRDYRIDTGHETCDIVSLLDNVISVSLPKDEPHVIEIGAFKESKPRIYVSMLIEY